VEQSKEIGDRRTFSLSRTRLPGGKRVFQEQKEEENRSRLTAAAKNVLIFGERKREGQGSKVGAGWGGSGDL